MKEFDYSLDYKNTLFKPNDKRYRIGRGEQGVLLVRPYTDDICKYWRFKNIEQSLISSNRILGLYHEYKNKRDFIRFSNEKDARYFAENFSKLIDKKRKK